MHDAKNCILKYLSEASINYIENKVNNCDTNSISDFLYLSRSTTSNYLNNLVDSGDLIKIKSRPVIYLHKKIIENNYQFKFEDRIHEFEDEDVFSEYFNCQISKKHNFEKEIGFNTSLKYAIRQCMSAIKYPPNGLPVLLIGEKGTGKKLISQHMFQYLIDTHIFDKSNQYFIFNCNLEKNHVKKLFGYYENNEFIPGFLGKLKKGLIYINHSEYLDPIAKEKLKNVFQNDKSSFGYPYTISPEIRFVLSCDTHQLNWKEDHLYQLIPIQIEIPSLEERFPEDKKQLIYKYIKKETSSISESVMLSLSLLNFLLNYKFDRNIDELKSIIKTICANAYNDYVNDSSSFNLLLHHLPDSYLNAVNSLIRNSNTSNLIPLENLNKQNEFNKLIQYYDKILSLYEEFNFNANDNFYTKSYSLMNEYFDFVVFNKEYSDKRILSIEGNIKKFMEIIYSKYNVSLPTNFSFVIARIIYFQLYYNEDFSKWELNHKNIDELLDRIHINFKKESGIMLELAALVAQNLDIKLDKLTQIFLTFYISLFNKNPERKHITSIILSHGYSTASSIADTCNRFLNQHVFESIDMPLNTSVTDIANLLANFFQNNYIGNEVILMVDMGSLENIGNLLENISNIKIGIINNISTKIALSIGEKILLNQPMETILKETCEETSVTYKVIAQQSKEKAILFTTETGITSTERIIQLFKKSIPSSITISIIPYDYYKLMKNKKNDPIFKSFQISLIISTMPIDIPQIPYLSLEDIINLDNLSIVNKSLSTIFSKDDMEIFNNNLIKYFSMESVLNYITILNPDVLLNFVVNAVKKMENKMNVTYSNKTRIGMYIHICCLIERLVTKSSIDEYHDIDCFLNRHKEFIHDVEECFNEISIHYNVSIPITEIAYLYDYVKNNK